jgi:hypothetical protein
MKWPLEATLSIDRPSGPAQAPLDTISSCVRVSRLLHLQQISIEITSSGCYRL